MTPNSDIKTFAKKVGIIAVAFLVVLSLLTWQAQDYLDSKFAGLKGGSAFWTEVESKLHNLADAPDLPEEKKARILASLKKLSIKYRPYLEALSGEK